MEIFLFSLIGYISGSIPYSVWLGKIFLKIDIRDYGKDKNPGTINAFKAGGTKLGIPIMLLDYAKGAMPVALAINFGVGGLFLIPVLMVPIIGHCFSPFLGFRGGKGVATTFGSWGGLTAREAPVILGTIMTLFTLFPIKLPDSIIVLISMAGLIIYFLISGRYEFYYLYFWILNLSLLIFTHKKELKKVLFETVVRKDV